MQRLIILFLFIFIFIFLLARIPYLGDPFWGEEGLFAHIFLEAPSKNENLIIGRVKGELQYCNPEHPMALYKVLGAVGKIFNMILPSWTDVATDKLVFLLRISFSLFFLSFLASILWFSFSHDSSNSSYSSGIYPFALISAVAISPLAITTSVGLQIDASSGVLLIGILPVLILAHKNGYINIKIFILSLFFGGFFTGLGKNEWNLAITAAIFISYLYTLFFTRYSKSQFLFEKRGLTVLFLGVIGGNTVSFLIDPNNYLGGFLLMKRIFDAGGNVGMINLEQYLSHIIEHLWSLIAPIILIFYLLMFGFSRISKNNLWFIFLAIYGFFLFLGFIVSPYVMSRGEMRYFMPSLAVLLSATVLIMPLNYNYKWNSSLVLLFFIIISFPSLFKIMEHMSETQGLREAHLIFEKKVAKAIGKQSCLPIIRPDQGLRGSFDFVSETIPFNYQEQFSKLSGKPLCPLFGHAFAPAPGLIALQEDIRNPVSSSSDPLYLHSLHPSSTQAGVGFNIHLDGVSTLKAQGKSITSSTIIVFNSVSLHGFLSEELDSITSPIPAMLFANPGIYPVQLYDPITGAQSNTIMFQVH